METGFKDRIKEKVQKKLKSPWSFTAPHYDQRSSCFVEAGDDHGVGHRQPVGHHGDPKVSVPELPSGKVNTQQSDYVYKGKMSYQVDINEK